ncbi:toxin-antitoxin system YwqK family antitoxin [Leptospira weilii]|uniref:toxin-antitoxin system YwqK family antitoxin n=1 Tax=Leptospira weilii TaxID=28184 RepID=UPI00056A1F15|nr:hypothetical protein [Leptospira weilii]
MFRTESFPSLFVLLTVVFLIGCRETIEHTDPNLRMVQGRIYYQGKLFTGFIKTEIPALEEIETVQFKNGLEDGETISRNKSGRLLERRYFKEGLKEGIHRSWFPNGNNRLYAEFRSGRYVNDRWEWHDNNRPFIYEKFDENGKLLVSKKWNRNGQIYMNTVIANDGSSLGLPGSKVCEPIRTAD